MNIAQFIIVQRKLEFDCVKLYLLLLVSYSLLLKYQRPIALTLNPNHASRNSGQISRIA